MAFISPLHYLEEQFGSCLGKEGVPQFVQHQEVLAFERLMQRAKGPVLSSFQRFSDKASDCGEMDPASLNRGGKGQGRGQVSHAGTIATA
jgi:hypothetical protein